MTRNTVTAKVRKVVAKLRAEEPRIRRITTRARKTGAAVHIVESIDRRRERGRTFCDDAGRTSRLHPVEDLGFPITCLRCLSAWAIEVHKFKTSGWGIRKTEEQLDREEARREREQEEE